MKKHTIETHVFRPIVIHFCKNIYYTISGQSTTHEAEIQQKTLLDLKSQ